MVDQAPDQEAVFVIVVVFHWRYHDRYDAYEVVLSEERWNDTAQALVDSTISSGLKYRGQMYDAETGLCYLRHRYYDPSAGSFTQVDPARAGNNWHGYCDEDPVNKWDPSGLDWEWTGSGWREIPRTPPVPRPPPGYTVEDNGGSTSITAAIARVQYGLYVNNKWYPNPTLFVKNYT